MEEDQSSMSPDLLNNDPSVCLSRPTSFIESTSPNHVTNNAVNGTRPSSPTNLISTSPTPGPSHFMLFEDVMSFISYAARAIAQDEFSKCFESKARTKYSMFDLMFPMWMLSIAIRYGLLFPIRLSVLLGVHFLLIPCLLIAHLLKFYSIKNWLFWLSARVFLFSFGAIVKYHGRKPHFPSGTPHIFVANHTSFTDYFLVSAEDYAMATVAQQHGGLFGFLQTYLLSVTGSLTFNRQESRDRTAVARKMRQHITSELPLPPLLVFPEGTCVNNQYTVLFHKGVFELDALICPVAIKYQQPINAGSGTSFSMIFKDLFPLSLQTVITFFKFLPRHLVRFLLTNTTTDPFWNTREQSFSQHAFYLMTRWFLVVDVWFLPPQSRISPEETSIQFADRVKAMISRQAGLVNLSWDGYLKHAMRSGDLQKLRQRTQRRYVGYLQHRTGGTARAASPSLSASSSSESIASSSAITSNMFPPWLPESTIIDIQNELLQQTTEENREHGEKPLPFDNERGKESIITRGTMYSKLE